MVCPKCLSSGIVVHQTDDGVNSYLLHKSSAKLGLLISVLFRNAQKNEYGNKCVCQACGYMWYSKRAFLQVAHENHVRRILGQHDAVRYPAMNGGYLQLDEEGILLYHPQKRYTAIPYDQLAAVYWRENKNPFIGCVTLRHIGNKRKPFPKSFPAAKKDKMTVLYDSTYAESYGQMIRELKAIAEANTKSGLIG